MSSHAFPRDPGNLAINQQEVTSLFSALWIMYFDIKVMRQRFDFELRILRGGSGPGRDEPLQPSLRPVRNTRHRQASAPPCITKCSEASPSPSPSP